jgi:hypothetical protein
VLRVKKMRNHVMSWKPLFYGATTLFAVLLAAGARWKP